MKKYLLAFLVLFFSYNAVQCFESTDELKEKAERAYNETNYDMAIEYTTKAMSMIEKEHGKNNEEFYKLSIILAQSYLQKQEHAEAEKICSEALNIYEIIYEDGDISVAQVYNLFAKIYLAKYNLIKTKEYAEKALEVCNKFSDNESLIYCMTLQLIGFTYWYQGNFEMTESYLLKANKLLRELDNKVTLLDNLNYLAGIYLMFGKLYLSEKMIKEALELNKDHYKSDNKNLSRLFNTLGNIYMQNDEYIKAEKVILRAYEINKELYDYNHNDIAENLMSLAHINLTFGRSEKAEDYYRKALEIRKDVYKKDHINTLVSLMSLASCLLSQEKFEEGEKVFLESMKMIQKLDPFGLMAQLRVPSLITLATIYLTQDKYAEAEKFLLEAEKLAKDSDSSGEYYPMIQVLKATHIFLQDEDSDEAKNILSNALKISKEQKDVTSISMINNYLGGYYANKYEFQKAKSYLDESLDLYQKTYQDNSTRLSQQEQEKYWAKIKSEFEMYFYYLLLAFDQVSGFTNKAMNIRLFSKGLLLRSSLKMRHLISNSGNQEALELFDNWQSIRDQINFLEQKTTSGAALVVKYLDSLKSQANTMEKELYETSKTFESEMDTKSYSWSDLQKSLEPNEAAIEIVRFRVPNSERSFKFYEKIWTDTVIYAALIVKPDVDSVEVIFMENGNQIEGEYINDYKELMEQKRIDRESYNRFWSMISNKVQGYQTIYFSPDGIYNEISPNSLFNIETKKFLIDEIDIHVVGNLVDVIAADYRSKIERKKTASLYGNPDYSLGYEKHKQIADRFINDRNINRSVNIDINTIQDFRNIAAGTGLQPLPGTEKEIDHIAKYLEKNGFETTIRMEKDAVESAIKSEISPTILHIATHGHFLEIEDQETNVFPGMESYYYPDPLMRSFLCLAGADATLFRNDIDIESGEDGLLTAREAIDINLINTDLVVLSACKTGIGEIRTGEGVYGLQRAFIEAGADALIMSLWNVPDDKTKELMGLFYEFWIEDKLSKHDAFIKAQKIIKNRGFHPYYWGAFVFVSKN